MIKARYAVSVLFSISLISLSFFSSAQVVDVSGCRAIEDRLQRFDCYESLDAADVDSRQEADADQSVTVQPAVTNNPPAIARPEERGQPAAKATSVVGENRDANEFGRKAVKDVRLVESKKAELVDTIAALEQRLPNLWLITLTNGQQWRQMQNKPYFMEVGDEVRIYPTIWGSAYRLTATRLSSYIQVERVD